MYATQQKKKLSTPVIDSQSCSFPGMLSVRAALEDSCVPHIFSTDLCTRRFSPNITESLVISWINKLWRRNFLPKSDI
ncbi:hypothetical protein TNCV_4102321 [Trichonephila clavipes]|nr:hypothetical protein TNCV_4102321 [Trichonephila clavipes]